MRRDRDRARARACAHRASGFVGGMLGTISANWSGFTGAAGFIWLVQCIGCHGESGHPHSWLATTTNGGACWRVELRHRFIADTPAWDGENGWTASNGGGASRFTATHDGGRTWTTVRVPRSPRPAFVSVADGTVWANAERCRGPYECVYPVLRGPASGSRLTPVPTCPVTEGPEHHRGQLKQRLHVHPHRRRRRPPSLGHPRRREHLATRRARLPGEPDHGLPNRGRPPRHDLALLRTQQQRRTRQRRPPKVGDLDRRWPPLGLPFGAVLRPDPVPRVPRRSCGLRPCPARPCAPTTAAARGTRSGPSTRISRFPTPALGHAPTLTARSATAATEIVPVTHTDARTTTGPSPTCSPTAPPTAARTGSASQSRSLTGAEPTQRAASETPAPSRKCLCPARRPPLRDEIGDLHTSYQSDPPNSGLSGLL